MRSSATAEEAQVVLVEREDAGVDEDQVELPFRNRTVSILSPRIRPQPSIHSDYRSCGSRRFWVSSRTKAGLPATGRGGRLGAMDHRGCSTDVPAVAARGRRFPRDGRRHSEARRERPTPAFFTLQQVQALTDQCVMSRLFGWRCPGWAAHVLARAAEAEKLCYVMFLSTSSPDEHEAGRSRSAKPDRHRRNRSAQSALAGLR